MAEEQTQEQLTLTVQDLTLTANIIDLAVQRGAFKGAELSTVGNQFDRLVGILKAIAPDAVTNDGDAQTEEASEEG